MITIEYKDEYVNYLCVNFRFALSLVVLLNLRAQIYLMKRTLRAGL